MKTPTLASTRALALALLLLAGCGGTRHPKIELEHFKKITSGMSLSEITKIMGPPAQVVEEGKTPDGKRKCIYQWVGEDGIEYRAWFEGETVGPTQWRVKMQQP